VNVTKMKWLAALLPATFVCLFDFLRHNLWVGIPNGWGNLMAALVVLVTSFLYFRGIFKLLKTISGSLQTEKEEKAILQERDRIARELHDSVSQALFFMNIKAKEIESALKQQRQPFGEIMELKEAIQITDTDVRQHIFNLQMVSQVNVDLVTAVRSNLKKFQEQSGIRTEFTAKGDSQQKLSDREKNQLIRMLQEALWNIRKHANAECVQVSLIEEGKQYLLTIKDNGTGFQEANLKERNSSFGLKFLHERAREIGAKFTIESLAGEGTTVSIQLGIN
jgi:signal transduction histidine kinase